jgi:probable rRNA maturation factor
LPLEIDIVNAELSGEPDELRQAITRSANVLPELPRGSWIATVLIANTQEVERLHGQFFGDPTDTDVMSFPSGDDLAQTSGYLGDVAVSVTRAAEQAHDAGHSLTREITFLVLHGLLHLLGYEDSTPELRQNMIDIQVAALAKTDNGSVK